ncbi:hypothetical protein [Ekhidna sp.]|uniref:hypothetical protein n=1 Tax=Ekhidna sp. TaxID=2608089 RepID=UPI003B501D4F
MESKNYRGAGVALVIASLLMIVTMVLHPVGGNFNHLLKIVTIGRVTHAMAILSLPFVSFGFWGLTEKLGASSIAKISFLFMLFGLIAVMLAAAVNGLILMDFVKSYENASKEVIDSLKPIFILIRSFNHAFDFIFIGAVCVSTGLWSYQIIRTKLLPSFIGWLGLFITLVAITSLVVGIVFVDLHGFRIFIFGWVAWVISIGVFLIRK